MQNSLEEQYMKIGAFSRAIGVSITTLRKWDKQGFLVPHHRTPSGYRVYAQDQIKQYFDSSGEKNVQRH